MKKILLVDDNKNLLVTIGDYLRFRGFEVTTAPSAEVAADKLTEFKPDLIVLDIGMPGMGGMGFLNRVVEKQKVTSPILVFTARHSMEEFFEGLNVAGVLSKTASKEELVEKIEDILLTSQDEPEAAAVAPVEAPGASVRKHVVLAEDDPTASAAIRTVLEKAGFRLTVLSNGPAVIESGPTLKPDVIVLKEDLPKMQGASVAALMPAMPLLKRVPVVLYDDKLGGTATYPPYGVRILLATANPVSILNAVKTVIA